MNKKKKNNIYWLLIVSCFVWIDSIFISFFKTKTKTNRLVLYVTHYYFLLFCYKCLYEWIQKKRSSNIIMSIIIPHDFFLCTHRRVYIRYLFSFSINHIKRVQYSLSNLLISRSLLYFTVPSSVRIHYIMITSLNERLISRVSLIFSNQWWWDEKFFRVSLQIHHHLLYR